MRGLLSDTTLVGRATELALLDRALSSVLAGHGVLRLIEGEGGIGKTGLLAGVLAQAEAAGAIVATGAGDEMARERPFGPLIEALGLRPDASDPERAEIGRLVTGDVASHLPMSQTPELRYRALDAVVALVERLGGEAPVVIAIEDLHWADPSTVQALHHIARHTRSLPVGIFGTARPTPRNPELERLAVEAAESGGLLTLGPLSGEAVEQLARNTLGAPVSPEMLRQLGGAGGNPFYVTELLNAIRADAGSSESQAPSLRLIILRRLSFLGEETLDVLRMASVLGSTFSVTDLSTVLERTATALSPAIREGLAAGILGDAGERLAFRHDLVREALYEDMPRAVRSGLHLQAARALAAAGASPVQVASQFALGATHGDTQAIGWLRRAAQQTAPRAPSIASSLMQRAVALMPNEDPERDEIIAEYVWSLAWSGSPAEAETLATSVLSRGHDPGVGRALRQALGVTMFLQGRTQESLQQFEALLADPDLPPEQRATALARLCLRRLFAGDFERARAAAEEAMHVGRDTGNDLALCEALGVLSWIATSQGNFLAGVDLGRDAVAAGAKFEQGGSSFVQPRLYPQSHVYLGAALIDADLLEEAEDVWQAGRKLAETQGADWSLPIFHAGLGLRRYFAGEWEDAVTEIETGIQIAEEIGTRNGIVFTWALLAHIAIHRDDLRGADDLLKLAEAEVAASGPLHFRLHWALRARALVEEARGNIIPACSTLDAAFSILERIDMSGQFPELGPDLVRLCVAIGNSPRAEAVTLAVEEMASRAGTPGARAAALRCRGHLRADAAAFAAAAAALEMTGRTVERAFALEEAGLAALATGSLAPAPFLEEAAAVFERAGAHRPMARVEAALREAGVRRGRRGKRRTAKTGWEALTPTELDVVRLATEGLTNREIGERLFVSRRTVETHLSHVFAKLGIATRVQLAAEASRAGVGKPDEFRR